ncbi:MAG: hypothetical protein ACTHJL_14375, partial [Amnibacterium sp.]
MELPASLDLTGRTALVTGAGSPSGIGFAAAYATSSLLAITVPVTLATDTTRPQPAARMPGSR